MKRGLALAAVLLGGCLPPAPRPTAPEIAARATATAAATPVATPAESGEPNPPLQLAWKYAMRHFDFIPFAPVETAGPVVAGNTVYAGSSRGRSVYALDVRSGVPRWIFHPGARVESSPAIGGGRVYASTAKGVLFGISDESGDELWHVELGGVSTSHLLYDEAADRVIIPTGDNKVHCVDAKTGTEQWVYRRDAPSDLTIWGTASPVKIALSNGDAYVVGFSDGTLVAIKAANGTPVWEQRLVAAGRFRDVDGQVASDATRIYVTAFGDSLYALERDSGRVIWSAPPGGATGVTIIGDRLFHGTDTGDVIARDSSDGREIWRWHSPGGVPTTPIAAGTFLYVASSAKTLYALRADTGSLAWTFAPEYRVAGATAEPAVAGKRVFMVSNVGTVYAFEPQSGASHYMGTWDSGTHRK